MTTSPAQLRRTSSENPGTYSPDDSLLSGIDWQRLEQRIRAQQRNREIYTPPISLFRWWARRSHALIGALLDSAVDSRAGAGLTVSDPFSGGGTVAIEAARRHTAHLRRDLLRQALEDARQRGLVSRDAYQELMGELDFDAAARPRQAADDACCLRPPYPARDGLRIEARVEPPRGSEASSDARARKQRRPAREAQPVSDCSGRCLRVRARRRRVAMADAWRVARGCRSCGGVAFGWC
jgi:hypothetical protein